MKKAKAIKKTTKATTTYRVFTDGSSTVYRDKHKLRYGGIGVYFDRLNKTISLPYEGSQVTNQRMELRACIEAIKYFIDLMEKKKEFWELDIYTDSKYTMDCILKWAPKWILGGWKTSLTGKKILNLDLIKELYTLSRLYPVNYYHVRSHKKEPDKNTLKWELWNGNKKADKLAGDAQHYIKKQKQSNNKNNKNDSSSKSNNKFLFAKSSNMSSSKNNRSRSISNITKNIQLRTITDAIDINDIMDINDKNDIMDLLTLDDLNNLNNLNKDMKDI